MESFSLTAWIYRGADWYVHDLNGPHVEHETATVKFEPTLVETFADLGEGVAKIVGVSDDGAAMSRATQAARERFGDHVTAAQSQPYYLDVTHPEANKGNVVKFLSSRFEIPISQIATIGDMPNDVLMFAHSGLSIAMGNASTDVQRAARAQLPPPIRTRGLPTPFNGSFSRSKAVTHEEALKARTQAKYTDASDRTRSLRCRWYRSGKTIYELGDRFGIDRRTVAQILRRDWSPLRSQPLTRYQIDQAITLYQDGLSLVSVGEIIGCSHSTIWLALHSAGVKLRTRPGWGASISLT